MDVAAPEGAVAGVDEFARRADLALTDDVLPTLNSLFAKRARRTVTLSTLLIPLTVLACGVGFALHAVLWVMVVAIYPLLLAGPLWILPRPHWPASAEASVAHLRRMHIRDYTDPWVTAAVIALWGFLSVLTVVGFVRSSSQVGREHALGVALYLAAFAVEYLLLARRCLGQRARAGTLQQLAFSDALTSEVLGRLLGVMPYLAFGPAVLLGADPDPVLPYPMSSVFLACSVGVAFLGAARHTASARRFRDRLYPNAPRTPRPPSVLTRLRGRWAS